MNEITGAGIVKVVQLKAKTGVSDAQIRAVADALQFDVEELPGYMSRPCRLPVSSKRF